MEKVMSKKDGRINRWKRNEAKKRKRHDEVMRMLSQYDHLSKPLRINMHRLFGK